MKTINLQLISFPGKRSDRNKLPHGPRAYICVKCISKIKHPGNKGIIKRDALSDECVTFQELEIEADRMIEELQQIKKQGMRFFKKELDDRFC